MSRMAHGRGEREGRSCRTRVWRLDQFIDLGFDLVRASLMADDSRVDLAQARKLVALGCPLETASRILL
jgi:hypothetical protein